MSAKPGKHKFEDDKNSGFDYEALILHKSVPKSSGKLVLGCLDSKLRVVNLQGVS